MVVYTARYVLPVTGPPIPDGAVAVHQGRIVAAGRRRDLARSGAEIRELGDVALLPGLVNAHAHLEFSWMRDDPPPGGDWVGWVDALVQRRDEVPLEVAVAAAERAIGEAAARGTVALGEVTNADWTAAVIARSGLHAVVFYELLGLRPGEAEQRLTAAAGCLDRMDSDADVRAAGGRVRLVLTPHAAHTTSASLLKALAGRAAAAGSPLSVHVAESEAETRFLLDGSGPFRELLERRCAGDPAWRAPGLSPVEVLDRVGALTARTLAVHVVRITSRDLTRLQARGVTVVTCPRSNRALGVGAAPVPKLLASGIPVALGTDSLASVPDLDLFAEMSALRHEHPGIAPGVVLRMATSSGAQALGLSSSLGSLETGKLARLAAVELSEPQDDPLEVCTSLPQRAGTLEEFAGVESA